ncbi:major facilitator superfamily transporter [Apiospora saccharicola]|uniref:Major facilitator superfamily transporter n=1 Tax=Apiospora saccharicola TaxID=335842 RepID=A0ABR1TM39_9PEZI
MAHLRPHIRFGAKEAWKTRSPLRTLFPAAAAYKPTTSSGGGSGPAPDDDGLFYSVANIRLWTLAVSHPLGGDLNSPSSYVFGPESPWSVQARRTSTSSMGLGSWRDFHERRRPVGTSWLSLSSGSPTGHGAGDLPSYSEKEAPRVVVETTEISAGRTEQPEEPYLIFNYRQKWLLIVATGALAFFAGLSSNIYFPAQDEIARVAGRSDCPGLVSDRALAQNLGSRSIFIFLLIGTAALLVAVALYLPETLRTIAGNGSLRLSGVYQPWMRRFKEPEYTRDPGPKAANRLTSRTVLAPLMLLFEKDILSGLLFSGLAFTSWGLLTATTTPMFERTFRLDEMLIGLCFLPNGKQTLTSRLAQ